MSCKYCLKIIDAEPELINLMFKIKSTFRKTETTSNGGSTVDLLLDPQNKSKVQQQSSDCYRLRSTGFKLEDIFLSANRIVIRGFDYAWTYPRSESMEALSIYCLSPA